MATKILGLDRLKRNMSMLGENADAQAARVAVESGAQIFKVGMERRAPRDTGRLARNILIQLRLDRRTGFTARVGPSSRVFYARFLEYGTGKQSARPFVRPTLDEDHAEVARIVGLEFKRALDALTRRIAG